MTREGEGDGTRWLDAHELEAWKALAHVLMLLPTALDSRLREDAGVPLAHYQMLAVLSDQPGREIRMTQLARMTGTTTSRLSHAMASLERRGLVERRACEDDGRGQVARLTDAGAQTLLAAAPGHVAEVRRYVFDHLDEAEAEQLKVLCRKLIPSLVRGI